MTCEEDAAADAGCPGCRRTAPYYATTLLTPDADEVEAVVYGGTGR